MLLVSGEVISVLKLLWWAWELLLSVEVEESLECAAVDSNEDVNEESELRLSENLCFGDKGGEPMGSSYWRCSDWVCCRGDVEPFVAVLIGSE